VARPVVVVSNRGPLAFTLDEHGELRTRRGGGGLVSTFGASLDGTGAVWLAGALSDADRQAASRGAIDAEGYRVELLSVDSARHRGYYDVICNGALWFVHHGLWDAPRRPRFDMHWWPAWDDYEAVNAAFAERVATSAPEGAVVLVHDYHLCLVAAHLREQRPDLATVHFHHTPFAGPDGLAMLPDRVVERLLGGLADFRACGFHDPRWLARFRSSCEAFGIEPPRGFVSPAAADVEGVTDVAGSKACDAAFADLDAVVGARAFIVRVDRMELSKNILRGFLAYDELLERHPEWRGRVVFGAFVYPSREGLAEYQAYRLEITNLVARINARWSTPDWTPILFEPDDDFPRSIAALRRYDVLLVNPVRDGLNLVAKEGAVVNERDGVLALSRESGVAGELGAVALMLHPFDVSGTADVLHEALSMDTSERHRRAGAVLAASTARTAADWFADQMTAAEAAAPG
jgi:trehalose 6-phosphate synthase